MVVWSGGPRDGGDWTWALAVALVYAPAGAALSTRAPRLATTFLVMAASSAVTLLAGQQAEAVASGRSDFAGALAVWLSSWTWVPAYVLLVAVVPHLLPDGRLLAGRWRWAHTAGLTAAAVATLGWMVAPYDELDEPSSAALALDAVNPVGLPGASVVLASGVVLTFVAGCLGVLSLVVRWRRSPDRRRLTWVVAGAVGTVVLLLASSLAVPGGSSALMALAVAPLPAAVLLGTASDATSLDRRLRQSQARLAVAQEEERRRLRHDLHDSLGPTLSGVVLQLEALSRDIEEDPVRAAAVAERLTARVREAVEEVRRLVDGLGSETALGLAEALRTQVESFDAPVLRSTLHLDPDEVRDLPAAVEVVAVRVVREALANVARHAAGDRCSVTVRNDGEQLLVHVRDNGIGISARRDADERTGVGLLSMQAVAQQIGGSCAVGDAEGGGTEVRLRLPLVPA